MSYRQVRGEALGLKKPARRSPVLLLAQFFVVFGDGVGVARRRIARIGAADAAVGGFEFAAKQELDFVDGVGELCTDHLRKLAVGGPAFRVELSDLLDDLVVFAGGVFIVCDRGTQPGKISHQLAVGGFGLRGTGGHGARLEIAGVGAVDAAGVTLPAGSDESAASVRRAASVERASIGRATGHAAAIASALVAG